MPRRKTGATAAALLSLALTGCALVGLGGCGGPAGDALRAIPHPSGVTPGELRDVGGPGGGPACNMDLHYSGPDRPVVEYYRDHLESTGWRITPSQFGREFEAWRGSLWLEMDAGPAAGLRAMDS